MNIHPISSSSFTSLNERVANAYCNAAAESMQNAAVGVRSLRLVTDLSKPPHPMCRVSMDGSWQKRGNVSLHGVVTAISEMKCVSVHVLTKYYRQCRIWERKKGSQEYESWKSVHELGCKLNDERSPGSMESVGAVEMFCRSVEKNGLIYDEYLGDGDSSSYNDFVAAKPYKCYCIDPAKCESVGHAEKRLCTRLRNKVDLQVAKYYLMVDEGRVFDIIY